MLKGVYSQKIYSGADRRPQKAIARPKRPNRPAAQKEKIMDQKYSVEVEGLGIKISTGSIAKQANGSVTISMGETNLLIGFCQ